MDKLTTQFSGGCRDYQNNFNSLLHYTLIRVIKDTNNLISLFAKFSNFSPYMILRIIEATLKLTYILSITLLHGFFIKTQSFGEERRGTFFFFF